jgi:fructokinase
MPEVISLGEALIDFVSLESGVDLIESPGFLKAPGGAPGNVACGLAKLGVSAAFIGKVGEDPFGHFLEQTFSNAGVDTSPMLFSTEARTGLAFVSLTRTGERDFVFYRNPSADMLLRPEEIDEAIIASGKVFHFGSITRIVEPSKSATLRALQIAKENGLLVSYDPNLRESLWDTLDHARREIIAGLDDADIVKVSEEELELITGHKGIEGGAAELLDGGIKLVAVTRGARGCYYANPRAAGMLDGFEVQVVDTTGCGDGFVAGMLVKVLESGVPPDEIGAEGLREAFTYANAVGALTATTKGAIPALPGAEAVEGFLAGR